MKSRLEQVGVIGVSLLALGVASASPTHAQDVSATQVEGVEDEDEAGQEEDVIVTGTRVVRPDYAYSNPVTSVTGEALEYSGAVNLTDFVTDLPALTNSINSNDAAGANTFIGGTGLNLLNLRNLGIDRTLVMVDSRRHVASLPGSAAVDVATIPIGLVERIDVSTGGASAIYGADGVSGVVNFILRDDFEGFEARAQTSWTEAGEADDQLISLTWGINTDGGRANLALSAEYTHEGRLLMRDRDFTTRLGWTDFFDNPAELAVPGDDPNIFDRLPTNDVRVGFLSVAGGFDTTFDGNPDFDGLGAPWDFGTSIDSNGAFAQGGSGIPVVDFFGDILPDVDRYAFNTLFHYDISNSTRFFTQLKYVNTQSFSVGQATFDQLYAVDFDNPFMPASISADLVNNGVPFALVNRFNNDFGFRGEDATRETYRAVIGFDGDLSENFDYEVSAVYGATASEILNIANRWNDRFAAAIDVVDVDPGPGQDLRCRLDVMPYVQAGGFGSASDWNYNGAALFGIGTYPEPQSFTPGPNSGCIPLNIFGEGSPSQAALDWVNVTTLQSSLITQAVLQAQVTGTLDSWFRLPGGSIGVAGGVEWREETSRSDYDPRDQTGLTFFNLIPDSSGGFDVGEAYAEVSLPLLDGQPFADSLALDAAVRISDYSTVGDTTSWKVGLVWAPVADVTFRSTLAQAVRAPNIGELFGPASENFAFITDPCDVNNLAVGTAFRAANCAQILNALGIDPTTFVDPNNATVVGQLSSNPDLAAETADTFTLGVILRPRFLDNFAFSADYYDIELTNAINTLNPENIAEQCVDLPVVPNLFCDLITRRPSDGGISFFLQRPENVAAFTTAGIDFSVSYRFDPANWGWGDWGSFDVRLIGNHLDDLTFVNLPGAEPVENHYDEDAPEWQAAFDLLWRRGPVSVNYGLNYFSETRRVGAATAAVHPDRVPPGDFWFDPRLTHDLQVRYDMTDAVTFYAGGINLGNQEPDTGRTYYPVGAEGRTFYLGLDVRLN